jgi:hypothetical protein
MYAQRIEDLLKVAAAAFADGSDFFNPDSLSANQVSLDECLQISTAISRCILGFLAAPPLAQTAIFLGGLASGPEDVVGAADIWRIYNTKQAPQSELDIVLAKLKRL